VHGRFSRIRDRQKFRPLFGFAGANINYAGLLSIELPVVLHGGGVFNIVVQQVTNASNSRPSQPLTAGRRGPARPLSIIVLTPPASFRSS
jgi:hypothetical protein